MASRMVTRLARLLHGRAHARTHPFVWQSRIEDFSGIDRTATVTNSRLAGAVTLGRRTNLDQCLIRANRPVRIDDYSVLTGPVTIVSDLNAVSIGKFCSLAPQVALWEAAHDHRRLTTSFIMMEVFGDSVEKDLTSSGPITIGNDVWIGTKAVVLSGVSIGDGAVIGAGSVVTQDVPPYAIAGGSPAHVLKRRFPEEVCARLLELRWWDWDDDRILRNRAVFEGDLTIEMLDRVLP